MASDRKRQPDVAGRAVRSTERPKNDRPITYMGVVYPWEADHLGHMNVKYYVGKFDEASWNLMALMGVDRNYLETENRAIAAVEQHIRYHREVVVGDTLTITSAVVEIGGKLCRFVHEMRNNQTGELVARMNITGVHMDTVTRKSCPLPDRIIQQAQVYLENVE